MTVQHYHKFPPKEFLAVNLLVLLSTIKFRYQLFSSSNESGFFLSALKMKITLALVPTLKPNVL